MVKSTADLLSCVIVRSQTPKSAFCEYANVIVEGPIGITNILYYTNKLISTKYFDGETGFLNKGNTTR